MLLSSPDRINEFTATLQRNSRPDIPAVCTLADADGPLLTIRSAREKGASLTGAGDLWVPQDTSLAASAALHVFFDNSVLELFLDDTLCFAHRFYKRDKEPVANLNLSGSYTVASPSSYTLNSIWPS